MIRFLAAGLLAAGLVLAQGAEPTTVVVLGDSYASGEGLATASGECGTEPERSWGAQVATGLGAELRLVACTGAEVADVTVGRQAGRAAQVAAAAPAPLALLTVGGNDLGFTEIVADCLGFAGLREPPSPADLASAGWTELLTGGEVDDGCDVTRQELLDRVDAFAGPDRFLLDAEGTTGSLADVYATVARRVVTAGGELIVVGYPQLFAAVAEWPTRYGQRCHALRAEDAADLGAVVAALDAQLAASAAAADAALDAITVRHVSLLGAIAGEQTGADHRLCGGGEPWINGLTVVEGGLDVAQLLAQLGAGPEGLDLEGIGARPSGSFHPSSAGHAGIASVVLDALER